MSSQYYLMSQLPSFSSPYSVPIDEAYFLDICSRCLSAEQFEFIKSLSLEPPREKALYPSSLVTNWYDWERSLRFALAKIRAARLKKEDPKDMQDINPVIIQVARTASGFSNALEAEEYLNAQRLAYLESLVGFDMFSLDALYAYFLHLKLAIRINQFNKEVGMKSYRTIYDTIRGEST